MTWPACACRYVVYKPVVHEDGSRSDRWTCEHCGDVLVRAQAYIHALAAATDRAEVAERQLAEARAALGLFAHIYACAVCAGPHDGCDVGRALEEQCIDVLGFDPHALGAACATGEATNAE